MLAPPALKAVHPLGKSPVLCDGELVLAESGAIIEYLGDRYGDGSLLPPPGTDPARLQANYWLHYAEGSLMPLLLLTLVFQRVRSAPVPFLVRPVVRGMVGKVHASFIDPQLALHLDYLERTLASSTWFGGAAFGAADVQMSFPLEAAQARVGLAARPQLAGWLERIHARPAYQRALERGGPFQLR